MLPKVGFIIVKKVQQKKKKKKGRERFEDPYYGINTCIYIFSIQGHLLLAKAALDDNN